MIAPPILITGRLTLEPLSRKHSKGMYDLWSNEDVCRHSGSAFDLDGLPISLPAESPDDSDKIIDFFVHHAMADQGFRLAILYGERTEFIGAVGFNALHPRAELAYHLRPLWWGQGLMREAAEAVLLWLRRGHPGLEAEAFVEEENLASLGLARRLGFAPTGLVVDGAQQWTASNQTP